MKPIELEFTGTSTHFPDALLDCLRPDADKPVMVTVSPVSCCLLVFPEQEWVLFESQVGIMPQNTLEQLRIKKQLLENASKLNLSDGGPVEFPVSLLKFARIGTSAVLVFFDGRYRLYAKEEYQKDNRQNAAAVALKRASGFL